MIGQKLARIDHEVFEAQVADEAQRQHKNLVRNIVREDEARRRQERRASIIEHGCTVDDLVALAASGKRFPVIYVDPPYHFVNWSPTRTISSPDFHYETSAIDQIKQLPVAALAADDATLLLWGTWPLLPAALDLIRAWGFTYKTVAFVWVKQNPSGDGLHTGMGYWTRSNSEYCLLATKGAPKRLAPDVHQIILAPVGEHSAKPEEVRRRIERLLGGPYLELYTRNPVDGWTCWGNEIRRDAFSNSADDANEVPARASIGRPR
jgi:N6-adenosine-specific RNA methylase IME4